MCSVVLLLPPQMTSSVRNSKRCVGGGGRGKGQGASGSERGRERGKGWRGVGVCARTANPTKHTLPLIHPLPLVGVSVAPLAHLLHGTQVNPNSKIPAIVDPDGPGRGSG